jgi:hypothetical protein
MRLPCVVLLSVLAMQAGTVFTFEPATYSTGAIEGQDGWYNPLTGGGGYVSPNDGTQVASNPTGGAQFAGMVNNKGTNARTEHLFDFSSASTWTVSYDILLKNFSTTDSENTAGSFSLQNASESTYGFLAALGWMNEGVPTSAWAAVYYVADSGGTAGQKIAWMNLAQDHWYRQTTVFDISTKQILSASLTDLTGSSTFSTLTPTDWYFIGGAASTFTPDAIRLFAGGDTVTGNATGWDNISLDSPTAGVPGVPEPATVVMAGAALAALALWRRR